MADNNVIYADTPTTPGEILLEELEELGMSQQELARRMGRPASKINEIIKGTKQVTQDTALQLERVLGVPAHVWMNLETNRRLTEAHIAERKRLGEYTPLLKQYPVREMEERGWIEQHAEPVDRVRELLTFFGVTSPDDIKPFTFEGAFRITGNRQISEEALAVWLRRGWTEGQKIETADFDASKFKHALRKIRDDYASQGVPTALPAMRNLCGEAGVALVVVQELPRIGANGVTRWLSPRKAMIQLSIRWRWEDIFWFTFFHEASHVLDRKKKVYIEWSKNRSLDDDENKADRFAGDVLLPPESYGLFKNTKRPSAHSVIQFAKQVRVSPGVVVGRLQHDKVIGYQNLNELRSRLVWAE